LITVVIPTYKRYNQLLKCLEGIFSQTLLPTSVIIVDDTPHDYVIPNDQKSSKKKAYEGLQYGNITITILKSGGVGGAIARNKGIERVRTTYLAFCDDDDFWLPQKLELQYHHLIANPKCQIVSCNYIRDYGQFKRTIISQIQRFNKNDLLVENFLGSFSFCMVRMSQNSEVRILDHLKACQDWYYWLSILVKQSGSHGFILEEPLVIYNDINEGTRLTRSYFNSYLSLSEFLKAIRDRIQIPEEMMHYHKAHLAIKLGLSHGNSVFIKLRLGIYAFKAYSKSGKLGLVSSFYRSFIYQFNFRKLLGI